MRPDKDIHHVAYTMLPLASVLANQLFGSSSLSLKKDDQDLKASGLSRGQGFDTHLLRWYIKPIRLGRLDSQPGAWIV